MRTRESNPAVRHVLGAFAVAAARRSLGALAILALGIGSAALAGAAIAGAGTAGATTPQSTGSSTGIPSDNYWLADAQGAVWDFGNAGAFGSAAGLPLNHPIIAMTGTKDQQGYWLTASDGGIFSYGDATFYGSTGSIHLEQPIVGMAATPDGKGYWLVASDGGIFNFGDAAFAGSAAGGPSLDPAERVVSSATGHGYWVEEQNGTAYAFGDAVAAPPTEALMFAPATPGDRAVLFAFAQLGKPYIWGGNGPVGYDCSGLALAASESVGVGFARVSDDQYDTAGQPVALSSLSAGDLVFWGTSQTDWTTVYHTAIYVGGDQIVEATGDHVQLDSLGQWGSGDLMPNGRRP